jgi:hypothetical protein
MEEDLFTAQGEQPVSVGSSLIPEFEPKPRGGRDCEGNITGVPFSGFDYIRRSTTGDTDYPVEACPPYLQVNAKFDNLQVTSNISASSANIGNITGTINVQSWKGFDIKHPNKENHRLRHICLEGPEAGVYVRGRLTDSNTIKLPEYWKGLIDPESITVSLTQIGSSQDLIVDGIEWGTTVKIVSGNASKIDCYYTIQASRIDGEPLIIEYEGETPADYPGSKDQFSISGYDYGRF